MNILFRRRLVTRLLLVFACAAAAQDAPAGKAPAQRLLLLEAKVNGVVSGAWLFVERDGVLHVPREALNEWRVQLRPGAQPLQFKGESYWPLSAAPGYAAAIDAAAQSVELSFAPEAFPSTRLAGTLNTRPPPSPVLPSVFFNYDLNYTTVHARDTPTTRDLGLLSEAGISTGFGVLTHTSVGRNLTGDTTAANPRRWLRLETTFTKDFLDNNHTLRLGDASTRAGMWGRNVYFGGIQYGSNFALTPGFWSQPLPTFSGVSAAPSTVQLYVNDVLRQSTNVPAGPFVLDNFPILTGSGNARVVVRDVLGRETVISQPFFTNSNLLAAGLNDWGVQAGSLRRDLGLSSNHYGPAFASGFWRRGYNNALTLEGRAELTPSLRTLGAGFAGALPWEWLGKAAAVASHEQSLGGGGHWLLGAEHRGLRHSAFLELQGSTPQFRQMGDDVATAAAKRQFAASWTYGSDRQAPYNLGLGYVAIDRFEGTRESTLSGNASIRVGQNSTLTLTVSRTQGAINVNAVGLSFIMPLGNNRVISAAVNRRNGKDDMYVSASQSLGQDAGMGWRVLAGKQQQVSRAEGGLSYLGRHGQVSGDVSVLPDQTALRLNATGGVVLADGNLFVTRRVNDSFAVAEVAGYPDIGIGLGSNVLSRTDANGVALIPRLSPYQANSVRLNEQELPISAEIDSMEQIAVPSWRSAVKVIFPVRGGRGALLRIVLDDNEAAPAGAIVQIEGDPQEFYVARRGEAFVTGLQAANRVSLRWNNRQCVFEVKLPPQTPDEIPRVGPLLCKGVVR